MNKARKNQEIAFLSEQFSLAKAIFLVSFKGINVEQITALRKGLNPLDARIKVVRNTLAQRAMDQHSEMPKDFKMQVTGDNALVLIYGEVGVPVKFLKEWSQDVKFLQLKAGMMEGQFLDKSKVFYLANLPSKKDLQAKLLGVLQAPAQKLVSQLATPMSQLLQIMNIYKDKK